MIFFHMNADSVSGVAANENFSSAHGVSECVACASADNNCPGVHCIAYGVLTVSEDVYGCSVKICSESIAGRAVNFYGFFFQSAGNKSFSEHVGKCDRIV